MNETEQIDQLTKNVQVLTQTLAHSEKRYQRIEHLFRWIGGGFMVLLVALVLANFDVIGQTYAKAGSTGTNISQDELMHDVLVKANTLLGKLEDGLKSPNFDVMMQGMGSTAVLMTRMKQDSDVLRAYMLASPPDMGAPGVQEILAKNNVPNPAGLDSLSASPAMSLHRVKEALRGMNDKIGTMAYSMGSTMGRMGNWMP